MKHLCVFYLLISLISWPSYATWYEGQASHQINSGDFDEIRTATIKKAVANASLKGHSYIMAEDVVLDGLLQSTKTVLRSEGLIRRVEIVDESIDDELLTVYVKVDIKPHFACQKDPYAKALLIAQFSLLAPKQATVGGIYDIGVQTTKRFEQQLYSQPHVFVSATLSKAYPLDVRTGVVEKAQVKELGRHLALRHNSQFILFGFIRDIGLFEQVKENLLLDDVQLRRNFTVQVYLYDAIKSQFLIETSYHGEANWQYSVNQTVDTNNSVFWRTDYGRAVLHTINSAVTDISDTLNCQQTLAQIIDNANGKVVVNIGTRQGVKVGDEFELINLKILHGIDGRSRPQLSQDPSRSLNVVHVDTQSAVLSSDDVSIFDDSKVLNLVSPKFFF